MWVVKKYFFSPNLPADKVDFRDGLFFQAIFLKLLGVWKFEENTFRTACYRVYCIVLVITFIGIMNTSQLMNLLLQVNSINDLADCYVMLICFQSAFKLLMFRLHDGDIKDIAKMLSVEIIRPKNAKQTAFVVETIQKCILSSCIVFMSTIFTTTTFPIGMFLQKERKLPVESWFPLDTQLSPLYEIFGTMEICGLYYFALGAALTDVTICVYMFIICGQCKILCDDLSNIHETIQALQQNKDIVCDKDLFRYQVMMEEQLLQCIRLHTYILKFYKRGEVIISRLAFGHMTVASAIIGCLIFCIFLINDNISEYVKLLMVLVCLFLQLLIYCFVGETVTFESSKIHYAIYEGNWLDCSQRYKKDLIFMMMRSSIPIQYSGLGVFILSLNTFIVIVKSAFSWFTLLRNM